MLKRTVSGITLLLLLLGLFSIPNKLSIECVVSIPSRVATYPVSAYENITTHEGDLIINGTQVFVIENCTFIQTGNIYVRGSAKLLVRNATVQINQIYFMQYEFKVEDYGNLEMEDTVLRSDQVLSLEFLQHSQTSFENVTLLPDRPGHITLDFHDFSEARVNELTWNYIIHLSGHCNVSFEDSRIFGIEISEETCNVKLSNSYIEHSFGLGFSRGSVVGVDDLKPGFFEYLDLKEKALVYGVSLNVKLNKTFVNSWGVSVYCDSETVISNSLLWGFGIQILNLSVHINDLKPQFYEHKSVGGITFNDTEIQFIEFTIQEKSHVTITNSTVDILHVWPGSSDVFLINSTAYELKAHHFFGSLCFEMATVERAPWMVSSEFYVYGNVSLEEFGEVWLFSSVTRNYGIIVKDRYDEPTVSDVSLTLLSEEDVIVWNGTTDNHGEANFNLTFTDGNYTDTLRLEAVTGNWSSAKNITFLSDTPVIFASPFPPSPVASFKYSPEKPVVNEQMTFNASESYSSKGDITSFEWNFNDGNVTTVIEPMTNHTYNQPGKYSVTLKVTDNNTMFNTITKIMTVYLISDLNRDETINILDISIVAMAFGSTPYNTDWNEIADLNNDEIINILDLSTIAMDFGKTV